MQLKKRKLRARKCHPLKNFQSTKQSEMQMGRGNFLESVIEWISGKKLQMGIWMKEDCGKK